MFSNSRPVPSKAALKVLYQLAYISSGAAVGVATLCAEERRRRTLLVQKIADNAKRIRQSPRYVHNKAREAVDEVEGKCLSIVEDGDPHSRKEAKTTGLDPGDRAVRGPELPSVVDNGYDQLVQRVHRGKRRRRKLARESNEFANQEKDSSAKLPMQARRTSVQSRSRQGGVRLVLSEKTSSLISRLPFTPHNYTVRRRNFEAPEIVHQKSQGQPEGRRERPSFITLGYAQAQRSHRIRARDVNVLNSKNVKHDIDLFFTNGNWTSDSREQTEVATLLLRLASRNALLVESRSLLVWLASRAALTEAAILTVCESSGGMAVVNASQLRQFYNDFLFCMPAFRQQSVEVRTKARVAAVIGALRSNAPIDELDSVLAMKDAEDYLPHELASQYYKLCHKGEFSFAAKLLCVVLKKWGRLHRQASAYILLINHCIETAIARGEVHLAIHLCTCKLQLCVKASGGKLEPDASVSRQLDQICQIVDERQTYDQLSSLCYILGQYRSLQLAFVIAQIGPKSKAVLVIASANSKSTHVKALSNRLRRDLSAPLQSRAMDAHSVRRLKETWHTTRNLSAVFDQYEKSQQTRRRPANQLRTLGPTEVALIEICNLAEQPHRALQILASTQSNGLHTRDSFALAALTLASKEAWATLEELVKIVTKSGFCIADDIIATRRLNFVIQLYTRQHDAIETWKFVTVLVQHVGFLPNAATTKTMLRKLVIHCRLGQPTLIPRWLAYVKQLGVNVELDSDMAVAIFRQYYRVYRIPHVLLMHMCRQLVTAMPSLQSIGWNELIKQAIGYDFRELDTRRRGEMRIAGDRNLAKVLESGQTIPAPTKPPAFRDQALRQRLQLPPADQELAQAEGDRVARDGDPDQFAQTVNFASASPESVASDCKLVEKASTRSSDSYEKLIEAFNSDDHYDHRHFTNSSSLEAFTDSFVGRPNHISPLEAAEISDPASKQREHEGLDIEVFTESDDLLNNSVLVDQDKIGYSGFDSSYRSRKLVSDMILALSQKRYDEILHMYETSLRETGLPSSPLALAVAVQAQIRRDGGSLSGARGLLEAASSAGFDVTCAMGPVLIREMRLLQPEDKRKANDLRVKVINYYRANDENGWPVSHHVGVSAANLLIDNRRPEYGVNLLDSIYKSEWCKQRGPGIVAMTVFLKGYIALRSLRGIMWTVQKVLDDGIRLNRRFLHYLRISPRAFDSASHLSSAERLSVDSSILRQLKRARAVCSERRNTQRLEAKRLGNKLIRAISLAVRVQQQPTEETGRSELARGYFGRAPNVDDAGVATARSTNASPPPLGAATRSRTDMAQRRRILQRHGRRMSSRARWHQLRKAQYRTFLKAGRMTADGQPISFRYYLTIRAGQGKIGRSLTGHTDPDKRRAPLSDSTSSPKYIDEVQEKHEAVEAVDQPTGAATQGEVSFKPIISGTTSSGASDNHKDAKSSTSLLDTRDTSNSPKSSQSLKELQDQRGPSLGRSAALQPAYHGPLVDNYQVQDMHEEEVAKPDTSLTSERDQERASSASPIPGSHIRVCPITGCVQLLWPGETAQSGSRDFIDYKSAKQDVITMKKQAAMSRRELTAEETELIRLFRRAERMEDRRRWKVKRDATIARTVHIES